MGYQFGSIVENLGLSWEWGILFAAGNVLFFWIVLVAGLKLKKGKEKFLIVFLYDKLLIRRIRLIFYNYDYFFKFF